jgi:YD repeat-containing protein
MAQLGNGISSKRVDFSYDANSQMTQISRYGDLAGNNLVASSNYLYDGTGRLIGLHHTRGNNVIASYGFSYDGASRISQFTSIDGVVNYSYDNLDQLIASDYDYLYG